jgi:hypothetical protein
MSDYFDRIESHLLDAVQRRANQRAGSWRKRPLSRMHRGSFASRGLTVGNIAAVGAVTLSIAVAAGVLVLLGGHRAASTGSGGGPHSARQQLIDSLSVLRRPQATADLDPQLLVGYQDKASPGTPDRSLIRVVSFPSLGAKVAIVPVKLGSRRSAARSEGLSVWLGDRGGGLSGTSPVTVASFRSQGINDAAYRLGGGTLAMLVVPDGVARVTLGPFRPSPSRTPVGVRIDLSQLSAAAAVRENVAALLIGTIRAPAPRRHPNQRPARAGASVPPNTRVAVIATVRMTWFAPNGKIVNQPTINLPIWVTLQPK